MIHEIYCKMNSDRNFEPKHETMSEREQILQQIKVIFGTKPGQVLGSYNFGINLEQYLFRMNYDYEEILKIVNLAIAGFLRYDTTKYSIYADVSFGHNVDDRYEYAVIDIIINEEKCLGILVSQ